MADPERMLWSTDWDFHILVVLLMSNKSKDNLCDILSI